MSRKSVKKMDTFEIGKRLKEVRKILRLTLEEISKKTGLSKSGISYMEIGNKKPSSVYMCELSEQFNVNINWVLTGKGSMFKPDVELNLKFGEDNEIIKELIFYIENIPFARHDILRNFYKFKIDNKESVEEANTQKSKIEE
jgi:transcriptional regulator with XRE-family HTH domain